jgi:hypothetical protein
MKRFDEILEASRDFFSSADEERETVDLIRRGPDAILAGAYKPFMKKLAAAIIHDRSCEVLAAQEERFKELFVDQEDRLRAEVKRDVEKLFVDQEDRLRAEVKSGIEKLQMNIECASLVEVKKKISELEVALNDITLRYEVLVRGDENLKQEWNSHYIKYPDPTALAMPMSLLERAANADIADAQYYLYITLGQSCIFDRFWHIKMKWLRRAAEQRHVEANKRMQNEFWIVTEDKDTVAKREKIYWQHLLFEAGEISEIEFLEFAWHTKQYHSSYGVYKRGHQWNHEICLEMKRRTSRLMKTYEKESPRYQRCMAFVKQVQDYLHRQLQSLPHLAGIMSEFYEL